MTLLGLLVLALIGALWALRKRFKRDDDEDLGSVSHQWMAEHRTSQTQDSQR